MGYEIRIHIMFVHTDPHNNPYDYGMEVATLDLCKCGNGPVRQLCDKYQNTPREKKFVLWSRDSDGLREYKKELEKLGNKDLTNRLEDGIITEDYYGKPIGLIPIDEFVAALKEDIELEAYRRFKWALALIEAIQKDVKKNIFVATFGH